MFRQSTNRNPNNNDTTPAGMHIAVYSRVDKNTVKPPTGILVGDSTRRVVKLPGQVSMINTWAQ